TIVANKASQSITVTTPSNFNPPTLTLAASGGGSGNPVTFTIDPSSTAAATSGNLLTATTSGNVVIDYNQAGNANYNVAAQVQQTIAVVMPTAVTVSFTPPITTIVD